MLLQATIILHNSRSTIHQIFITMLHLISHTIASHQHIRELKQLNYHLRNNHIYK